MPEKRIFTEDEKKLINKMYHEGYSYNQIKDEVPCGLNLLRKYLNENNYPKRPQKTLLSADSLKASRKHYFNEHYFDVIDTEDKAYWLGFWFADGNVRFEKSKATGGTKGGTAEISLKSTDRDHLVKMLRCMDADENYPIQDREIKLSGKKYYACRVKLQSIDLCYGLNNQGCVPKKSLILKPPHIREYLIPHFVRGYFDGDGCVSFNEETKNSVVSVLGTPEVLEFIKYNTDISDIKITKDSRNSQAYCLTAGSILNILIFYNYIYKNATVYLDRKKQIFDKLASYLINKYPEKYQDSLSKDPIVKHARYNGIPIVRISLDFKEVKIYQSAQKVDGFIDSGINKCINHRAKTYKGFYWLKYKEYKEHENDLKNYINSLSID